MSKVLLGDVVNRIKDTVDKDNTDLEYYIGGEHFDYGEVTINKKGAIAGSTIGPAFHMRFQPGDVLLMSRNPHLRKAGMVDFEGICSDVSYVCRTKDENILLQDFLPFIFQSDSFWTFAEKNKKGSTNFFLNWSDFEKYEFELPDIETQKELAEVLWAINDTRKSYISLKQLTDELVKSQFIEMFRLKTDGNYKPLKECCSSISGGNTPSMKHPEYYGGQVPFIKSGDVKDDTVSSGALWLTEKALTETTAKLLPKGTVIVVIRSAALLHEFHTAITLNPVVINQDLKAFQPKNEYLPEYLMWSIKVQEDSLLAKVQSVLTSHIEMNDLLNIPVYQSSLEQQKRFCEFVKQHDKAKHELSESIEKLDLLSKRIIIENIG